MATRIESAYDEARTFYAERGVDTDAAMKRLATVPISLHCWQGDDVGGFEQFGTGLGGGLAATGNYPGKARTPDELRADFDAGAVAHPRPPPPQPARHLRRVRRQEGRPRSDFPRALRRLDRLGQVARHRPRFQPDLLLASQGGRRLHAVASRRRHPPVLDRARHRLPPDRRGDGPRARHALRHQRLDSRRLQGHARRPRRPARAPDRIARRDLRRADRPGAQPRRRRGQAVRHRLARATSSARTSSTSATRCHDKTLLLPRRRPFSPDRDGRRQDLSSCSCSCRRSCCTSAAACAGTATTSSCSPTSCEAHRPGDRARRLPRPRPHRPRLLRRQHQPRRRLGHRHAQHAQGAAHRPARADRHPAPARSRRRLHGRLALLEENKTLPFGAVWDHYCEQRTCPSARRGCPRSGSMKRMCCRAGNPLSRQHNCKIAD